MTRYEIRGTRIDVCGVHTTVEADSPAAAMRALRKASEAGDIEWDTTDVEGGVVELSDVIAWDGLHGEVIDRSEWVPEAAVCNLHPMPPSESTAAPARPSTAEPAGASTAPSSSTADEVGVLRWDAVTAASQRRTARQCWEHFPGHMAGRLERENCGGCVLEGYGAEPSGPNYAGWERIYVQLGRTIPPKWWRGFLAALEPANDNPRFAEALWRDIATWGVHKGHKVEATQRLDVSGVIADLAVI